MQTDIRPTPLVNYTIFGRGGVRRIETIYGLYRVISDSSMSRLALLMTSCATSVALAAEQAKHSKTNHFHPRCPDI